MPAFAAVAQMLVTQPLAFWLDERLASQQKTQACYWKSGQEPMALEVNLLLFH